MSIAENPSIVQSERAGFGSGHTLQDPHQKRPFCNTTPRTWDSVPTLVSRSAAGGGAPGGLTPSVLMLSKGCLDEGCHPRRPFLATRIRHRTAAVQRRVVKLIRPTIAAFVRSCTHTCSKLNSSHGIARVTLPGVCPPTTSSPRGHPPQPLTVPGPLLRPYSLTHVLYLTWLASAGITLAYRH